MDLQQRYSQLLLNLGKVAGLLSYPDVREQLVSAVREQRLRIAYVELVRDQLEHVLEQAREPQQPDDKP